MKTKLIHDDALRTHVVVLDKGERAVAAVTDFARRESITGASITAIGAFQRATVGYFDRDSTPTSRCLALIDPDR